MGDSAQPSIFPSPHASPPLKATGGGVRHNLIVPKAGVGQRVDVYLAQCAKQSDASSPLAGLSRARLQKLINSGDILVNQQSVSAKERLRLGDRIAMHVPTAEPSVLEPVPMNLHVLFEDQDLIAVAKPPGLLVHPGAGAHGPTLVHGLLAHCGDLSGIGGVRRPGIVHRLDQGTSGVMVVAKNDRAHEALARQFARRETVKRYLALVLGVPAPAQGVIDTWYGRHPVHRRRFTSRVTSGRRAVTRYEVRASLGGLSLLDVLLGTGRTHQIRVHLAERCHPIVGDPIYGGRNLQAIGDLKLRAWARNLVRQALHAQRLEVFHPRRGTKLVLEAPLPADLLPLVTAIMEETPNAAGI